MEGQDLSLFYGDETNLTTITESRKFLSKDVYRVMVQDAVICCVDVLIVRRRRSEKGGGGGDHTTKKECLLVERSSEPVRGVWWLPGGRLLKGETFFAAAARKARDETGLTNVRPVQVLGVWNTFFPTSHWDDATSKGTQTVNPIVLVELTGDDATEDVKLDATSENYRWIGLDPQAAQANGEDRYVVQALLRLNAWNPTYAKS
jgi:ADP-ribose pyrophosphatase YjhB (NUDIX family)